MPPSPKPYSPEELEELRNTLTEEEFAGMFDEDMVDDPEEGAEFDEGQPETDEDGDANLFADQNDIARDQGGDDADQAGDGDDDDTADDDQANGDTDDQDAAKADAGADPDADQSDDASGADAAAAEDEIEWPDIPEPPKFETKEAPEALTKRADELERSLAELAEKHDEGEITSAEFTKESRKIQRELGPLDLKLANATVTAEDANAMAQKHWGETTVPAFLEHFPEYRASPTKLKTLDQVVREIQVEEATNDPLHPEVLKKAHARIVQEYGWKFSNGKKAAPADPAKPADGGKKPAGVKPAAQRQMPPTLARVPAAEHEETVDNSRWAAIDRLQGVEYEEAVAKLSEAEHDAYLQSQ